MSQIHVTSTGRVFDGEEDITLLFDLIAYSRQNRIRECQHQYHAPQASRPGICELCGHVIAP